MSRKTIIELWEYLSQCGVETYELLQIRKSNRISSPCEGKILSPFFAGGIPVLSDILHKYSEDTAVNATSLLESLRKRFPNAKILLSNGAVEHLCDIVGRVSEYESRKQRVSEDIHHNIVPIEYIYLKEEIVVEHIGTVRTYRFAKELGSLDEGRCSIDDAVPFRGPIFLFLIDEFIELLSIFDSENEGYSRIWPVSGIDYTIPMRCSSGY